MQKNAQNLARPSTHVTFKFVPSLGVEGYYATTFL